MSRVTPVPGLPGGDSASRNWSQGCLIRLFSLIPNLPAATPLSVICPVFWTTLFSPRFNRSGVHSVYTGIYTHSPAQRREERGWAPAPARRTEALPLRHLASSRRGHRAGDKSCPHQGPVFLPRAPLQELGFLDYVIFGCDYQELQLKKRSNVFHWFCFRKEGSKAAGTRRGYFTWCSLYQPSS